MGGILCVAQVKLDICWCSVWSQSLPSAQKKQKEVLHLDRWDWSLGGTKSQFFITQCLLNVRWGMVSLNRLTLLSWMGILHWYINEWGVTLVCLLCPFPNWVCVQSFLGHQFTICVLVVVLQMFVPEHLVICLIKLFLLIVCIIASERQARGGCTEELACLSRNLPFCFCPNVLP